MAAVFENIKLEVRDKVATLWLNRPKVLNALNRATLKELQEVFHYIKDQEGQIEVVIFTGMGEKAFIAGADIKEMSSLDAASGMEFASLGQSVTQQMESLPQPIIGAVNGFALGGGCEFALACDFILASENGVFGQPEVALGVIPGFGGCVRLFRSIGVSRAREWIYTGKKISAQEAKDYGLVLEVFPLGELLDRAHSLAKKIQKNSLLAVAQSKRAIHYSMGASIKEGLLEEAKAFSCLFGTHDQQEGMGAFLEKRKPEFKGSRKV